jgi:hypothetical protein
MRTTVTLDPDVEALLRKPVRQRGEPFKQALNAAIRDGLASARRKPAKRFRQPTFDMGSPMVDLTKALSLAAELEDAATLKRTASRASRRR